MTDIPPISGLGKPATEPVRERFVAVREGAAQSGLAPVDRVEISDVAQTLSALNPEAGVRAEKVAEIRQAIADGTYLTDEKIAITVDRLLAALRSLPARQAAG